MFSPRIRLKPLAQLCRRLAVATAAGLDDRRIWRQESERGGAAQRAALAIVRDGLERGQSAAESLERTGEFFPRLFRQTVAVGETSGRLDRTYKQLAEHYERTLAAQRTLRSRLAWPALQLASAIVVVGLLIAVMGYLQSQAGPAAGSPLYDPLGLGLTGRRGLFWYVNAILLLGILAVLAVESARRGAAWSRSLATLALRTPLLGEPLRTLALSRFAWAAELLLDTPMDLRKSLPLALEATGQSQFSRHASDVSRDVGAGKTVREALEATGEFPRDMLDAIEVGEQTGMLPETMRRVAADYNERAAAATSVIAQLIGYAVWALVALMIIVVIVRIFSSYVATIQGLSQPGGGI
jgi:type IV pilus assembly protein PilC